jgi:hypothetical protein
MELGLILLAGLVYIFWRSNQRERQQRNKERQQRDMAAREELARFSLDKSRNTWFEVWRFDLDQMSIELESGYIDFPNRPDLCWFHLRRNAANLWEYKETLDSRQDAVARLRREMDRDLRSDQPLMDPEYYEERLADLQKPPVWSPLPDEVAPVVEIKYQRFMARQ